MVGRQSWANIKILCVFNIYSFSLWTNFDLSLRQLCDLGARSNHGWDSAPLNIWTDAFAEVTDHIPNPAETQPRLHLAMTITNMLGALEKALVITRLNEKSWNTIQVEIVVKLKLWKTSLIHVMPKVDPF